MFAMNWGMDYWVSYSFYYPASPKTKSKSMKKHRLRMTASTSREQMTIIPWVHCNQRKNFELLLLGQIRWYPGFNQWLLPTLRTRLVIFIQKMQLFVFQCFIQCSYWKICIALLCLVFTDPVTYWYCVNLYTEYTTWIIIQCFYSMYCASVPLISIPAQN